MSSCEFKPVQHSPYTFAKKVKIKVWSVVNRTIFRWTPWFCRKTRVGILRMFGANIDWSCSVHRKARIDQPWNLTMGYQSSLDEGVWLRCVDKIVLGSHCIISHDVEIAPGAHDLSACDFRMISAPVVLSDNVWVASKSFIHKGVTMGEGAVASSCSVVVSQVPPWSIVAGNPARVMAKRELKY